MKTLYKLARKQLFRKEYYCIYCDMIDSDKEWIWKHIRNTHDESGKLIRLLVCEICKTRINETHIINHISTHQKLNNCNNKN